MIKVQVTPLALALALSLGCGGASTTHGTVAANAPYRECALGSARLSIPVPLGYALAVSPEACVLVNEDARDAALISFAALDGHSAEGEAVLAGADGARDLMRASGLFGADTAPLDEPLEVRLFGRDSSAHGLRGRPQGLGPSEIYVLSRERAGEALLVMLITPEDASELRAQLLTLLAGVR